MRIEQLAYIAAVIRLGSLRRAGEELHISQPALSETVRNLEAELGVTLLDRLRAAAAEQHRSSRMIRVGTVNAATVPLLIPAIRTFRGAHPPELVTTELVAGRPVVCLRSDHPLASGPTVSADQLRAEPLIAMRAGYVMHRYVYRLFAGNVPAFPYSTDGAEMGKLRHRWAPERLGS